MIFRGTQVVSGDVLHVTPLGLLRWFKKPFLAVVDTRDRSIPYYVRRHGDRVAKIPLEGAPFEKRTYAVRVYRLPGISRSIAATIAAAAAERMGEGIHHPSYDCGWAAHSDAELIEKAYAAAGVRVSFEGGVPSSPLTLVRGPQDPPNEVIDAAPPTPEGLEERRRSGRIAADEATRFVERGIERTLPWQKRGKRRP